MSSQPPGRPRSTPIPGSSDGDVVAGSPLPGNLGSSPLTPSEFAAGGGAPSFPPGPTTPGGFTPPPGGFTPPPGGFGTAYPGMPGGFPAGGVSYSQPRKRSPLGCIVMLLIFIGPAIGVGIGIWAFFKARDAVDNASDLSNPDLSGDDREALGLPDDVEDLWGPGAADAVIEEFIEEVGADPLMMTEAIFYTDYAFATVQDPAVPTHIDRYQWRSAEVGAPTPETNDPDLAAKLFSSDEVTWGLVNVLSDAAPAALGIEQGEVSHVIVSQDSFSGVTVIRVYVTGPRDSGYLEADAATGEVRRGT